MTEAKTQLVANGCEDSALFGEDDIDSATSLLLSKNPSDFSCSEEVTMAECLPLKGVSFHNISYQVTQRRFFKKSPPKTILHNVR